MFGRIREMIFTPNDVRNLHFHVVHDVDEMENPRAVRPANSHVRVGLFVREVEINFSGNEIINDYVFTW